MKIRSDRYSTLTPISTLASDADLLVIDPAFVDTSVYASTHPGAAILKTADGLTAAGFANWALNFPPVSSTDPGILGARFWFKILQNADGTYTFQRVHATDSQTNGQKFYAGGRVSSDADGVAWGGLAATKFTLEFANSTPQPTSTSPQPFYAPVPRPSPPPPPPPPPPVSPPVSEGLKFLGLAWWIWLIIVLVLGGAGFLFLKK